MESKSNAVQVHPEEASPILNQPTTQVIVDSNLIANNVEGYLESLNLLSGVGRLYIQHEPGGTNGIPNVKMFHVSNEAGERIFIVNVLLKSFCDCNTWFPRDLINKIEICNLFGNQIIIADYIYPNPSEDCCASMQDVVANRVQFNVQLGNYMPLGQFNYTADPCECDPNRFSVDCMVNQDKYLVEASGACCLCKMFYFCRQRFHSFRIKQYSYPDVIGEMHIEWPEYPGLFGIGFTQTMPIESKAMLLVLGIYLNEQHLEEKGGCGRVGNIGLYQIKMCTLQTLLYILVLSFSVCMFVFHV